MHNITIANKVYTKNVYQPGMYKTLALGKQTDNHIK